MKNLKTILLSIFLISIFNTISAQDMLLGVLPTIDKKVTYTNVIEVKETSQKELNNRAKSWFAKTFRSSQEVIQMNEDSQLIGKGFYTIRAGGTGLGGYDMQVWITITIQFKENRYRYLISDFIGKTEGQYATELPIENWNNKWKNQKSRDKRNAKVYPEVNIGVQKIIESLEKEMNSNLNSDW